MFIITQNYIDRGREINYDFYTEEYVKSVEEECTDDNVPMNKSELHEFIILDDDDNVYFRGYSDDSSSFDPLDWAMSGYGCTAIMYQIGDTWEYL